ncbi:hypothetical protein EDD74_14021 [Faecalimonas umbilicata]|uniref:Uncharacterized protein n=1 Tax=Faecalimonas umbilicata TaxID=1912855 RepID=A0A4R3J7G2_9FIRM|nr:hypothetical protein [Faecalimonas umbilicata]TCS60833.1 hypothetical protein EDD74_14021 [Faecalimonas umbilicata]GBU03718.1 hypothetical protein FAEUMB_02590 [Faecalimonas umbilicata]
MEDQRKDEMVVIIIVTVVFGVLSKCLVGVPYMAWGYFDKLFIASFILWMFYSTILYMAIKIENGKNENYLKLGFTGVVFGLISACLKMGLDAIIEQFTKFDCYSIYDGNGNPYFWKCYYFCFICLCCEEKNFVE